MEEEVAAALTLTGRAAGRQVSVADGLARLPGVARALAAGRIDLPKAMVFTGQLMLPDVIAANAIAGLVLPQAPGMTTGRLRQALIDQIMDYDPEALVRRRKEAEKDARVETWTEAAGTGALAGRDLPPAAVLAADQRLTADARWLKSHGVDGTMDQLRAMALTARLTGQSLDSLLPPAPGTDNGADASPANAAADGAEAAAGDGAPAPASPVTPGWPGGFGGSVNLTMPAGSWLGQSDKPGQISGLGAADAGTCRDVADTLARDPSARWCITLLGPDGQPVAHGCARAGPGRPAATAAPGSPRSRSPRSRPGPVSTGANRPGTSRRTRCGTSSRSEAPGAGHPAAAVPPWPATTTTPSRTTGVAAPANATCTRCAGAITRPNKPTAGS